MKYKHLFFDLDKTIAPSRQPILPEMYGLLDSLEQDIIIVSGQNRDKIQWQTNELSAIRLGQNGNEAHDVDGTLLWDEPLSENEKEEINNHIESIISKYDLKLNEDWNPIEDRGCQITFSPVGNTAPIELKQTYDPDAKKRLQMIAEVPLKSDNVVVKIGGTTSLDYIPKTRHKGTNVAKLIALKGWDKDDCVYYGDGLYPGGNDEAVIGVIETIPVENELDTFDKLNVIYM